MSEFEKLMKAGSRRPSVQKRVKERAQAWRNWRWIMLIGLLLALIPPHIGGIIIFPGLVWGGVVVLIEWQG